MRTGGENKREREEKTGWLNGWRERVGRTGDEKGENRWREPVRRTREENGW